MRPHLKSHWAHHVQITNTAGIGAFAGAFERGDGDGQVIPINKADIIEVLVAAEGDFGKSGRRSAAHAVAE